MLKDIIEAQPLEGYQVYLKFEDEVQGVIDLTKIIEFTGIFAPLSDPDYFATVTVNPGLGTICWDNGADIDPVVLYAKVSQVNLEDYFGSKNQRFPGKMSESFSENIQV
ncbi:DUF2442 domain-containing protein [Limnospira fusiformis KN01]|uniref:DUF2442 domain-containing protein n=1 Tax=Limnospira fusiformis TaxID=54297 RepID=UPI00061AFADB|nr:DUF2442 domain-containing protein [Limnospira fusiformis]QJB26646.1 DUF2442 domain-containing protein [Limnospira fusiformis SAG 85.79]ULB47900.1 DUF2442 domain-containing protein [Limnospira fusiformis KN01]